jgi:hypothetical protein
MAKFGEIGKTVLETADDEELVRRLFTEDHVAVETCATGYRYEGIEQVWSWEFGRWVRGFPDMGIEVRNVATVDDLEIVEAWGWGTHTGPFDLGQHLEPTGKRFEIPFCSIYKIKDGRATHSTHFWDDALIMSQLGVLDLQKRPLEQLDLPPLGWRKEAGV